MKQNMKQTGAATAFLITASMCLGMPAFAQQTNSDAHAPTDEYDKQSDDGGIERIFIASKFESMSQRIPAAACVFVNSNHSDSAAPLLTAVINEFDKDLLAIYEGNQELGFSGAEHNHRVLVRLDELKEIWEPFEDAAKNLVAGEKIDESMAHITKNNLALLEAAEMVFTEVSTEYANPVLVTESEALLIDFADRERMLIERISKESCAVISGNADLGSLEDLNKSIATFEAILDALRNGLPSAGVAAAPTEEIRNQLKETHDHWSEAKVLLSRVTGKDSFDHDTLEELFELLEKKRENMNEIAMLYTDYAHTHH